MHETQVTLTGWLGSDVTTRTVGDATVAGFRLAATPRRFNPRTGEWADAQTQWFSVNAWRALGGNCASSLRRGDAVVVHGKLSARTWTSSAGVESSGFEIEAAFVGHDLNRGTTAFTRSARAEPVPGSEEAAEPSAEPESRPDAEPVGEDVGEDRGEDRGEDVVAA